MRILLAVTTYNQLGYTKLFLRTLPHADLSAKGYELRFYDDCSTDGTVEFLKQSGYAVESRSSPEGLTFSWNRAYRRFKDEGYDALIIANNDVLVPMEALEDLVQKSEKYALVAPMTNRRGAGAIGSEQRLDRFYPELASWADDPDHFRRVQNKLHSDGRVQKLHIFLGFFFVVSRNIIPNAWDEKHLFNPDCINTGQEHDLRGRLPEMPVASLSAFVFHFKGVSFSHVKWSEQHRDRRNEIALFH